MSNKTDFGYNEDDFVERGGQLEELTVTITLCEYRNLISDHTYNDKVMVELQEKNMTLEERVKSQEANIECLLKELDHVTRLLNERMVNDESER